ncbi:hypothetical protein GLOIN_2v1485492 [Rhizophagus irregularis DAOM 181602=DAOM 197198]|nr:hypothetical protein GLOIN_2v1485492 [Rhizophagus irregularis DAOM 181602=DAOM 197198]
MGNKKLRKEDSPESEILYESSSESESKSESELGTFSMSYNSAYCVLNILIHCLMVNIQLIELNPEGTQILDSDSRPRDDKKRKRSKERRYQHVSEMPKDLREALRKRKKRSKTINNLKKINDPLIEKFSNEELRPIITENGYHSPEISESEDERNIIILRRFLYYVDSNITKGDKKREQVYKPSEYVEETAPNSAPSWTKSGYDGPLKNPIAKAISKLQNK